MFEWTKSLVARIFIASREQPDISVDDTVFITDSIEYKSVDSKEAFSVSKDGDEVVMDRVRDTDSQMKEDVEADTNTV